MALLMREMANQLEDIKSKIEQGEDISKTELDFALIHNQKPTDQSFLKEPIVDMSNSYAYAISSFNQDPSKENYQSIINNCINCHQISCPGPMSRIKKLKIK